MKTLEEFLKEISENEALRKGFEEAADQDNVVVFFKQHDCEATLEEIIDFVKANDKDGAVLSEEELASVAGGRKLKCVKLHGKTICS